MMTAVSAFKVMTFDCYGTLIDWETGLERLIAPWLQDLDPETPADQVISCFARMQAKHQQARPALPYPEVLRRCWRDIEAAFGWEQTPWRAEAFAESVGDWPPFEDTVPALRQFSRSHKLAILSNVDNASLARTLERLEAPFVLTVTAEDVGAYKPARPHFDRALEALAEQGFAKHEILHVAQSKHHDIAPGNALGLTTAWVDRRRGREGNGMAIAAQARPDITVASLAELAALHRREAWS